MSTDTVPQAPQGTSTLAVLGVGALLLILVGAVAFISISRGRDLDATEVIDDLFVDFVAEQLTSFTVEGARLLPSGERVVTFAPVAGGSEGVPVGFTIVEYPAKKGDDVLGSQFRGLRFDVGEGGMRGGGHGRGHGGKGGGDSKPKPKLQEKSFLAWHGYDATFARMRHSVESPKSSYDVIRVNLSTGGRCIIAYVRYAEGATGDKQSAADLVAAFTPQG